MVTSTKKPSPVSVAEHLDRILSAVNELSPVTVPLSDAAAAAVNSTGTPHTAPGTRDGFESGPATTTGMPADTPRTPPSSPLLSAALGRTLAHDVIAMVDVPSFDNSAMDGYAMQRADVAAASAEAPVQLNVVADLPAGTAENPALLPGQAARIMTGAPMPDAADCVVPVEETDHNIGENPEGGSGAVRIFAAPKPAAHIRHRGTDARAGETVVSVGKVLNGRDLSAAAATGCGAVTVIPAPRVAVLSTGSELREAGEPLERGQIHDSNSILLAGLVAEAGAVPVLVGPVPDDNESLRATLDKHASRVDAFVTSGGVSVGAYDVVKAVLAPRGVWFGTVRMQPGKPQGFGLWPGAAGEAGVAEQDAVSGTPIFALPGNPVSVFVSFELFVRPALKKMQGRRDVHRPILKATVTTGWRCPVGRTQYMPAVVEHQPDGTLTVRAASAGGSGSYLVASLAGANALATVGESVTEVRAGDVLDVTLVP